MAIKKRTGKDVEKLECLQSVGGNVNPAATVKNGAGFLKNTTTRTTI